MWNWCPSFFARSAQPTLFGNIDINNDDDEPCVLAPAEQPTYRAQLTGWATKAGAFIGTANYVNFVRDGLWSYFTADYLGLDLKTAAHWSEANAAQWLYPTLAMLAALLPLYAACQASKQIMPWTNAFISITAASLAIPGWNIAAKEGIAWGKRLGMSAISAGYFSSLFTGLAEGPIQEIVTSFGQLLTIDEEKKLYKEKPRQYVIDFLKRLGLSATLGAIPGAVWQLAYYAAEDYDFSPVLVVALAVMISNKLYALTKDALLPKQIADDGCEMVDYHSPVYGSL